MFWPTPIDRPLVGEINWAIEVVRQAGATAVTYRRIEFVSNVLMFVPIGVLGVLAFDRVPWWLIPAGCLVLSVLVELAQLVFLSARLGSIVDVAANLAGALLGATLARLVKRPGVSRPLASPRRP